MRERLSYDWLRLPTGGVKNANLVSRRGALVLAAVLAVTGCRKRAAGGGASIPPLPAEPASSAAIASYSYEIVHAWPHDRGAFTQGLLVWRGNFIESTGLNGQSSLREVELTT